MPEATIATGDHDFDDDNDFQAWLREDQPEKTITMGFRKRTAFNKMGFNEKHIPFQGKARYIKEK